MNPILLTDYYKTEHYRMYPENTTMIYSNFTPRKSRIKGISRVVFFGLQHFIIEYLLGKFKTEFFDRPWKEVEEEYKFAISTDTEHIKKLHKLGYLPIKIKAVKEGTFVDIGVPCFTIRNTHPDFAWLTNYLETLISCQMWQPITSATLAYHLKKLLLKQAASTGGTQEFVNWQGHDFAMRGMSSIESAILSGMGHLTSFTGTDTIPAIYAIRNSYGCKGLIGASVPATEHSVMCMGTKEDELETFRQLLKKYPTGILSVVSDTWNLWKVLTEYLPALKDEIMARDGKLVIRPDSGDPVDIICGKNTGTHGVNVWYNEAKYDSPEEKGVIELLWDTFGGTINEKGYRELDSHIGAIYGDSINYDRASDISERLKAKHFASTNLVYGVGSFTYQYNTRDTFGFAMKATYGELTNKYVHPVGTNDAGKIYTVVEGREIFKNPITDDGTKKSAKGLLVVDKRKFVKFNNSARIEDNGYGLVLTDEVSWKEEALGVLETVFENGKLIRKQTFDEIRELIAAA